MSGPCVSLCCRSSSLLPSLVRVQSNVENVCNGTPTIILNSKRKRRSIVVMGMGCSSSSSKCLLQRKSSSSGSINIIISFSWALVGFLAAASVAIAVSESESVETLSNIPQTLSAEECTSPKDSSCNKAKIQRPKSRKAESCTIKCVTTCIRGGDGEGPLNVRRPLVVFKQGFRTRHYCLVECSDICNLISDVEEGP